MSKKKQVLSDEAKIRLNGQPLICDTMNDYLLHLLQLVDVKYSPMEAIKDNFDSVFHIFIGFCEDKRETAKSKEKTQITRLMNHVGSLREEWCKIEDREVLTKKYYDKLMSLQGLSGLRGFKAVTRFGDVMYGDPEKMLLKDMRSKI